MPPFGSRKARPPEAPAEPVPRYEPSATERLNALLAEQAGITAQLGAHGEERERLLREDGSLGAIRALATEDDALKLRLEQIAAQLPNLRATIQAEQRAAWEAAWQSHRPGLIAAQERLVAAITEFHAALHHAQVVFNGAAAFGARVSDEFVRPFPEESYNRYATTAYLRTVEQRQRPRDAPASSMLVEMEIAAGITAVPRFKPRRVDPLMIEQISAIAPPRRIRVEHGPVRVSNLAPSGFARLLPGQEETMPARAAAALVMSGCAVYTDAEAVEATAA